MPFRKILFWVHLVCGVVAGLVIAIMSFTGAALAFEKELVTWAERDSAYVVPPAPEAKRLPIDELVRRVREVQPDARPASIVLKNDPDAALSLAVGAGTIYVNPYTAEIRPSGAEKMRAFMRVMNAWHRTLALADDNRALGKAVTGACNVAFLVLAVTGLYLWMPRIWSKRVLRPSLWFVATARGKARDWNWHNVLGFWFAPVFIVLTATALPMSYLTVGDWLNRLNGPDAAAASPGAAPASLPPVTAPSDGAKRLDFEALLLAAQQQVPDWKQITMRLDGGTAAGRGGGARGGAVGENRGGRGGEGRGGRGGRGARAEGGLRQPGSSQPQVAATGDSAAAGRTGVAQPVSFNIREAHSWPRTATTMLTLDPFTGTALSRSGYADQATGRKIRSWTRFLHTGEALGPVGQFFAGLACLGACVLVWTGFALALRRFFGKRAKPAAPAAAVASVSVSTGG